MPPTGNTQLTTKEVSQPFAPKKLINSESYGHEKATIQFTKT